METVMIAFATVTGFGEPFALREWLLRWLLNLLDSLGWSDLTETFKTQSVHVHFRSISSSEVSFEIF